MPFRLMTTLHLHLEEVFNPYVFTSLLAKLVDLSKIKERDC